MQKMIHLQKRRQSRKAPKSGSGVRREAARLEMGEREGGKEVLVLYRRAGPSRGGQGRAEEKPKLPCDPAGLLVAEKHVQGKENTITE